MIQYFRVIKYLVPGLNLASIGQIGNIMCPSVLYYFASDSQFLLERSFNLYSCCRFFVEALDVLPLAKTLFSPKVDTENFSYRSHSNSHQDRLIFPPYGIKPFRVLFLPADSRSLGAQCAAAVPLPEQ